jgi:hypothetical protein
MKTAALSALGALIILGVGSTGPSAAPYPPSRIDYYQSHNVQKAAYGHYRRVTRRVVRRNVRRGSYYRYRY